jgi:DNA invertase Pin-like site-specific DNA recombinase
MAAIYTRISADSNGDALGVQRQEADARRLCETRGWTVVEVFCDNDRSAFSR